MISLFTIIIWDKILKNGLSKICGRQPLKNLKWYCWGRPYHLKFFKGCLPFLNTLPHLIRGSMILAAEKSTSKKIYDILIFKVVKKPSSNIFFEELFKDHVLNREQIYSIPRISRQYIHTFISIRNYTSVELQIVRFVWINRWNIFTFVL